MKTYEYNDDYGTCVETYSTLRIYSDDLLPDDITGALKRQPTKAFAKGEEFGSSARKHRFTGWFFSTEGVVVSKDTRRHVDAILSELEDSGDALISLIDQGCRADICSYWLSVGQGGPMLEPEQMKRLSDMRLSVWWDVYFDDPTDIDE